MGRSLGVAGEFFFSVFLLQRWLNSQPAQRNMADRKAFILVHPEARRRALAAVAEANPGSRVTVADPKRTDGQNDRFHAICGDIAKSGFEWAGKRRTTAQWKVLLVSGHAAATHEGFELVPGLENEFVNLRESTALMSVKRGSSLIEYSTAWALNHGITLRAPEYADEPVRKAKQAEEVAA